MQLNEESVFTEALAKGDPQERAAFLDQACAGDPTLRDSVESLLGAYEAGSFLESPAVERPGKELKYPAPGSSTQAESPIDANDRASLEFLSPSDKTDVLGRLGHYDILEIIGRGGMGIVLRAFDDQLHRVVAIKVMAAQLATNATARRRFAREAQAAAAVSHDHIVTIHAVAGDNPQPYLVMQYVAGLSLQQRLDRVGPLELQEILRIGMQTAAGLAAAHAQGLVHRDIKPANILLENGVERVKITDFGLARAVADASLTQSGVVTGTPKYMSPEQARGDAVDQRTDLFSLGSVLYAMCTGRAPFRGSSSVSVLKRVCDETPPPIRETNPEIPDWLVAIVTKLQAKNPAERFQSAAEVAERLQDYLAHLQHPSVVGPLQVSRPPQPPTAGRRRMVAALALLSLFAGAILLIAAVTWFLRPERTPIAKDRPTAKAPPTAAAANPDPHPFVLLGGQGVAERKFDTLADAVLGASDGDTIEVRGNGPFVSEPINLSRTVLTIRAGAGFRPMIRLHAEGETGPFFLQSDAALVLEGLELQREAHDSHSPKGESWRAIISSNAPLYAANCRFLLKGLHAGIVAHSPILELRNCALLCTDGGNAFGGDCAAGQRWGIENCVQAGGGWTFSYVTSDLNKVTIRVVRNTMVRCAFMPILAQEASALRTGRPEQPVRIAALGNVFDTPGSLINFEQSQANPLPAAEAEAALRKVLTWQGLGNLYAPDQAFLSLSVKWQALEPATPVKSLADWAQFWGGAEVDSLEGRVRYHGGDLLTKLLASPEKLTPDDFRLRPDSAGYRAGKDGKDLGADIDLVGPGPAYERWKKTPEYQQWLGHTGQVKK